MANIITFANHKGGATKTTSAANLGVALAQLQPAPASRRPRRVLLIDADPQANLSTLFGCDPDLPGVRLEDVIEREIHTVVPQVWTSRPAPDQRRTRLAGGVHVLPCTDDLAIVARDNAAHPGFGGRLRNATALLRENYDYILIDTPPGRQALTTLALLATDYVIAPIRPADFDVEGAIRLTEMLENEIHPHNPGVKMLGVLLAQADPRWKIGANARDALGAANIKVFERIVPFAVSVGHAPRFTAPTIVLQPAGRVAAAYRHIATALDQALMGAGTDRLEATA
jgi:chromosome partitioning protein